MRLKLKQAKYVALHQLKGETGNLYLPRYLLPFLLSGETDELLVYFAEVKPAVDAMAPIIDAAIAELEEVWAEAASIVDQKEFALFVKPRTRLASFLFDAKRTGEHPVVIFRKSTDRVLKSLFPTNRVNY